jgi:hypothetical protein
LLLSGLGGLSVIDTYISKYPPSHTSTLRLLLDAGAPFNVGVRLELDEDDIDKVLDTIIFRLHLHLRQCFTPVNLHHLKTFQFHDALLTGWVWVITLRRIVSSLVLLADYRGLAQPSQLWDFIEVWLEFGAMPAYDITRTYFREKTAGSLDDTEKLILVNYKVPVRLNYRNEIAVV